MARNRERDAYATTTAEGFGWIVVRVWECEITADPQGAAERVLDAHLVVDGVSPRVVRSTARSP